MGNSVSVTYTRRYTDKGVDGSFETIELGGTSSVDLPEDVGPEDVSAAWDTLYDEFVQKVEGRALETSEAVFGKRQLVELQSETQAAEPETQDERLSKWVSKSVKEETDKIRNKVATIPGEKFAKPPQQTNSDTIPLETIVEGEAVSFKGVRVFYDNSQTKVDKTRAGKKYGMLRIGQRGEIPGDYVTAKSFEPDIVADIESLLGAKPRPQTVDVYGYFEPRSNNPEVFDLVIQGLDPAN